MVKPRLGASPSSARFTAFWTSSCFPQSVSRKLMSSLERDTKRDRFATRRFGLGGTRPGIASSVERAARFIRISATTKLAAGRANGSGTALDRGGRTGAVGRDITQAKIKPPVQASFRVFQFVL